MAPVVSGSYLCLEVGPAKRFPASSRMVARLVLHACAILSPLSVHRGHCDGGRSRGHIANRQTRRFGSTYSAVSLAMTRGSGLRHEARVGRRVAETVITKVIPKAMASTTKDGEKANVKSVKENPTAR